jgi:hypothetical protein
MQLFMGPPSVNARRENLAAASRWARARICRVCRGEIRYFGRLVLSPQTPSKINNAGDIIGEYRDNASVHHGFLLSDNQFSTIDFPGARETFAQAINVGGDIVGRYIDAGGMLHGFLLSGGSYITLDGN